MAPANRHFTIGAWQVDVARNTLSSAQREVRLEPKVMTLLVTLASRPGEVIAREELLSAVWQDAHVTDGVLTTAIYQLRRVLGSGTIETIPRRGYRLVVTRAERRFPRRAIAAAALLAVAITLFAGWRIEQRRVVARELSSLALDLIDRHGDLGTAIETLERVAPSIDEARVWGSLAYASVLREKYARAGEAARIAVGRDPQHSEARIALALAALWRDWRWDEAERQLALAGPSPRTFAWRAYFATLRGRSAEAKQSLAAMSRSGPVPPDAALTAATTALLLGSFEDAEKFVSVAAAGGGAPAAVKNLRRKIADRRVEVLPARHQDAATVDRALTSLERACANRDPHVLYLNVDRRWDHLRDHSRFRRVLRSAGL